MKAVVFWEVLLKRKHILLISDKLATRDFPETLSATTKNSRQSFKYLRPLGDLSMVWVQGGDGQKKARYLWCLTSVKAEFVLSDHGSAQCYELHMVCVSKHF